MNSQSITTRLAQLSPIQKAALQHRLTANTISGHEIVAMSMKTLGVSHVYAIAGTPIHETLAACLQQGIRVIGVRHQQAAVMMALSHNYVEGRMTAVVMVSKGPAVLNTLTGISVAADNCWPVLVIAGVGETSMKGMGDFQELDALPIIQPLTKCATSINDVAEIGGIIENSFRISTAGRYGPVFVEIPEDILKAKRPLSKVNAPTLRKHNTQTFLPTHSIRSAAEMLTSARRPLLIIGKSVIWANTHQELSLLVDDFQIPFITSPMNQGYLPDDHRYCFNTVRSFIQSCADVVIIIGARLNWVFRYGSEISKQAKVIQFDTEQILPGKNIHPEIAVTGNIKQILNFLLADMEQIRSRCFQQSSLISWFSSLDNKRSEQSAQLEKTSAKSFLVISPDQLMKEIRDFFPKDSCYIFDGNVCMTAAERIIPSYFPASRFTAGTNGCMGIGIPFGIGAKLARANRTTVVISGDFAFGLNAMEMETALRYKVAIIIIVVNNSGSSGALREKQHFAEHPEPVTTFTQDIHYEKMIKAFGGHSECVTACEQLVPAFTRSVASGKAALINVIVDPDAPLFTRL